MGFTGSSCRGCGRSSRPDRRRRLGPGGGGGSEVRYAAPRAGESAMTEEVAVMPCEEELAAWLPGQRWFAGKGTPITDLAVAADTTLVGGDPGLRHLIVDVTQATGTDAYQLFLGVRADLPDRLEHVRIGPTGP